MSDDHPWWAPVVATFAVLVLTPLAEGIGERIAVAVFGAEDRDDEDERDALAVLRTIVELENE
jgi:hypothetical protein